MCVCVGGGGLRIAKEWERKQKASVWELEACWMPGPLVQQSSDSELYTVGTGNETRHLPGE